MRARGISIFAQTILLLLLALLLAQAVNFAMIVLRPAPPPDIHSLFDIGDLLAGRRASPRNDLVRSDVVRPPVTPENMVEDANLTAQLAGLVGKPVDAVRLWYEADQSSSFPFRRERRGRHGRGRNRDVLVRRGEPMFFNAVVGAVQTERGWRVVQTPPRPFLNEWQQWTLIWFGVLTLLLVPIAWLFVRRLTGPMRRFVEAADRFGRDDPAPVLPAEGPAELRTMADALNRMQERIDAQIRERTAMIGAIAHDLRTPLARIAFRTEAAPEALRDKIQADVDQMRAMIAHTISFVRGAHAPLRPERIDLAALATHIADVAAEMKRPVRFAGGGPAWVMGDALALERLLDNLVNNAVAFGGGAEIVLERAGGRVAVLVRDKGPGLSETMLSRAFEPFERGEPSRSRETGGVGLGLTIARTIARSHGGDLTLANRAGGGLEAQFTMPLAA